MTAPARVARPQGLVDRIAGTFRDPRGGARIEIDAANEPRLLFYAVAASLFHVLGAVGVQILTPDPEAAADFDQWATTQVVIGTFFRPLGLYAAAALIGLVCRAFGGRGGWRDTRAAFFWSGLAAAPAGLALTVAAAGAVAMAGAPAWIGDLGGVAAGLVWAWLLGPGLAEAQGFRSGARVFAVFAALAAGAAGLGWWMAVA
ncbi:MAG: YIP1 family protein [Rubrimonas sp.]|uniref:YIP1 family protein n=1 Tax=Rubrimonas sp. TaxID=2036015 RepID=UPI002FDE0F35